MMNNRLITCFLIALFIGAMATSTGSHIAIEKKASAFGSSHYLSGSGFSVSDLSKFHGKSQGVPIIPTLIPESVVNNKTPPASFSGHYYEGAIWQQELPPLETQSLQVSISTPQAFAISGDFYYVILSVFEAVGRYSLSLLIIR